MSRIREKKISSKQKWSPEIDLKIYEEWLPYLKNGGSWGLTKWWGVLAQSAWGALGVTPLPIRRVL